MISKNLKITFLLRHLLQLYIFMINENAIFSESNSKTIVCNENGYFSIFRSDRYGFNNPDYEWDKDEAKIIL